ncbi:piezo-type mechanosensitive ion channel-like protein isoform X1 [Raphanus sativus]|nr:piezo-type mechanosensitive ion channel-like protein isoform X1 [Raphanus sativus]
MGIGTWSSFLIGFLLPSLLLAGYRFQRRHWLLWPIFIFSFAVLVAQALYLVIWATLAPDWDTSDSSWMTVIGFIILKSWRNPTVLYFLALQLLASLVALADIYSSRFVRWRWSHFSQEVILGLPPACCYQQFNWLWGFAIPHGFLCHFLLAAVLDSWTGP